MNITKELKKIVLAFMMISSFCFLVGCGDFVFDNESSNQIKQYEQTGREIIEQYLSENFSGAEITSCSCRRVYEGEFSYITDYVEGEFCVEEESYYYVVNVYSGDVFTTYYEDEIGERICEQIFETLGIENYGIQLAYVTKVVKTTEDKSLDSFLLNQTTNVCIPGNINEDNLNEFILEVLSGNGYSFNLSVCYNDNIRIEDIDFNQLNEKYENVKLTLIHKPADSDIEHVGNLDREEEIYVVVNETYRYKSFGCVEKDDVFLIYEENTCDGDNDVEISKANLVGEDNFSITIDDEKIDIVLKEDVDYYLCFHNMDFLKGKSLYYFLTTTKQYKEAEIVQEEKCYYSTEYYGGIRPIYQSETFYIGNPEEG